MSSAFKNFLCQALERRGLDPEIMSSYLLSILKESSEADIDEACILIESVADIDGKLLLNYYFHPELIPVEQMASSAPAVELKAAAVKEVVVEEEDGNLASSFEPDAQFVSELYKSIDGVLEDSSPDLGGVYDLLNHEAEIDVDAEYLCEIDIEEFLEQIRRILSSEEFSGHLVNKFVFSDECLLDAIDLSGDYDVMKIIDNLLYNYNLVYVTKSTQPCINFLKNGGCFLYNCKFNHDLEFFPCKYWMSVGGCVNGENCPFTHCLAEKNEGTADGQLAGSKEALPNSSDFPSLGNKTSAAMSAGVNYKSALSKNPTNQNQAVRRSEFGSSFMKSSKKYHIFSQSDWVSSGESLCNDYIKIREDARRLAVERNQHFEMATNAYITGNSETARSLSLKGKELNEEMWRLQSIAAKNIFLKRNSKSSILENKVDLHGLHVNEALSIFEDILYFREDKAPSAFLESLGLQHLKIDQLLYIITGTGNHSEIVFNQDKKAVGSRVLGEIMRYCDDYGFTYNYIRDQNKFIGGIII